MYQSKKSTNNFPKIHRLCSDYISHQQNNWHVSTIVMVIVCVIMAISCCLLFRLDHIERENVGNRGKNYYTFDRW